MTRSFFWQSTPPFWWISEETNNEPKIHFLGVPYFRHVLFLRGDFTTSTQAWEKAGLGKVCPEAVDVVDTTLWRHIQDLTSRKYHWPGEILRFISGPMFLVQGKPPTRTKDFQKQSAEFRQFITLFAMPQGWFGRSRKQNFATLASVEPCLGVWSIYKGFTKCFDLQAPTDIFEGGKRNASNFAQDFL